MARTEVTLTNSYQEVADVQCAITVKSVGDNYRLTLNQTAATAAEIAYSVQPGDQFVQNEEKSTFALGEGIVLIVDTVGD